MNYLEIPHEIAPVHDNFRRWFMCEVNGTMFSFDISLSNISIPQDLLHQVNLDGFQDALRNAIQFREQFFVQKDYEDEGLHTAPWAFQWLPGLYSDTGTLIDSDNTTYNTLVIHDNWYIRKHGDGPIYQWLITLDAHNNILESRGLEKQALEKKEKQINEVILQTKRQQDQLEMEEHLHSQRVIADKKWIDLEIERARSVQREAAQRLKEANDKIDRKRGKPPKSGYVYVIKEVNGVHFKIGRTKDPDDRVATFNVKLPMQVDYEWLIETEDMYQLERIIHKHYAERRVNGEWFCLSETDLEEIKNKNWNEVLSAVS